MDTELDTAASSPTEEQDYQIPSGYGRCFCPKCNGQIRVLRTIMRHSGWSNNVFVSDNLLVENETDTTHSLRLDSYELEDPATTNSFDELPIHSDISNDYSQKGSVSVDSERNDDSPTDHCNLPNEEHAADESNSYLINELSLEKHILRSLESKVKYGWSQQAALDQLLSLFNLIGDEKIPYKDWDSVLKFLRGIGYEDARHEKVCIAADHVLLLKYKEQCCQCGKTWKSAHDYYILGLRTESIFLSKESVINRMQHWENKDNWFQVNQSVWPKREIWDGERFQELSYFWDQDNEFQLPDFCPSCSEVLSCEEINAGNDVGNSKEIVCPECRDKVITVPTFVKGSPLNQAFLFHEDGFNAFLRKTRGVAAINISSGCCLKSRRGESHSVYSFVPTCFLPEKVVHKFDAFLEPLVADIANLYISGVEVTLTEDITIANTIFNKGIHLIRCLLLLGTADIKAHAEMVLYATGGKHGCRRCMVEGVYDPARRHYYYQGFLRRSRFPAEERTPEKQFEDGLSCDNCLNENARKQIQLDTGIRGVSILFKLYKLYKFDPIKDMMIDRMHLSFNMLKREFLEKMWIDMGENSSKPVNERNCEDGGLVVHEELQHALNIVEWTREQKASGSASVKCLTDKLGGWKSDQYIKFSLVAKAVLAGRIPSKAYDCFLFCCEIAGMLYSKFLRNKGWSENHVSHLNKLLWTHAIKAEEFYGGSICSENLEYSVHVGTDIVRHSGPDNYSCDMYERVIRKLKEQRHNAKGLEKTYCERENLRLFLIDYQRKHGPLYHTIPEKFPYRFEMRQQYDRPFYLHERSFIAAKKLLIDLKSESEQHVELQDIVKSGVLLGSLKRKNMKDCQHHDIQEMLRQQLQQMVRVPKFARFCDAVVKYDSNGNIQKFAKNDFCVISGGPNLRETWNIKVTEFILVGPHNGKYYIFVDGKYYIPAIDPVSKAVIYHPWTKDPQLVLRNYNRGRVQLSSQLLRTQIMYPEPLQEQNPSYHLSIDFDKPPEDNNNLVIPVYPIVNDCIAIKGRGNATWYGRVLNVDYENKKVRVKWFDESRPGLLKVINQYDNVFFRSILRFVSLQRSNQGYVIKT